jgi:hypothetical protein
MQIPPIPVTKSGIITEAILLTNAELPLVTELGIGY